MPMLKRPQQKMSKSTNYTALDPKSILEAASCQWLSVAQLMYLLDPKTCPMVIASTNPKRPPPSGTLILYNRAVTRRYKDDGYRWVKKRNSTKVREDHVKLRLDGAPKVSGTYVHCIDIPTLHRRAYHIIPGGDKKKKDDNKTDKSESDDKSSQKKDGADKAENPTWSQSSSNEDGAVNKEENSEQKQKTPVQSLILVHYLDTRMATRVAASQAHMNIMDISNIPHPSHFGDMGQTGINPMMKFASPALPLMMMTDGMNSIQNNSFVNGSYQGNEQQLLSSYQGRGSSSNIASISSNFKSEQKGEKGEDALGEQLTNYLQSAKSSQNDSYLKYCEKNLESFKNGYNNITEPGGLSASNRVLSSDPNSYLQNYGTSRNDKNTSSSGDDSNPNNGNNDDYLKYCQKNLESFNKMYKAMQEKAGKNFNAIQELRGSEDNKTTENNGNNNMNMNKSGELMNQAGLNNYFQSNNGVAAALSYAGTASREGQFENNFNQNPPPVSGLAQNLTPSQQQRLASVADSLSPQTLNMLINMIKDGKDDDVNAFLEKNRQPPHPLDGNNNMWNSNSLRNNGAANNLSGQSTSQQQNYINSVYQQRQQQVPPIFYGGNHQFSSFGESDNKRRKQHHLDNSDGGQGFFPGYQAQLVDSNNSSNNRRAEFQQEQGNNNPNAWPSLLQQHQSNLFPGAANTSNVQQSHSQDSIRDFPPKKRDGSYF